MNSIIVTVKAQTAHYRLMLQVGPPEEKMYSEAEAAKLHPTSGEILVTSGPGKAGQESLPVRSPR